MRGRRQLGHRQVLDLRARRVAVREQHVLAVGGDLDLADRVARRAVVAHLAVAQIDPRPALVGRRQRDPGVARDRPAPRVRRRDPVHARAVAPHHPPGVAGVGARQHGDQPPAVQPVDVEHALAGAQLADRLAAAELEDLHAVGERGGVRSAAERREQARLGGQRGELHGRRGQHEHRRVAAHDRRARVAAIRHQHRAARRQRDRRELPAGRERDAIDPPIAQHPQRLAGAREVDRAGHAVDPRARRRPEHIDDLEPGAAVRRPPDRDVAPGARHRDVARDHGCSGAAAGCARCFASSGVNVSTAAAISGP